MISSMYRYTLVLFSGLVLVLFSCKKEEAEPIDFHLGYFGLEANRFVEYEVTEITHDASSNLHDTVIYNMKVIVGAENDTVLDNSGRVNHKIYRYKFDEVFGEYKIKDLWTAIIVDYRAEMVEENQRLIKLIFSPNEKKEWNINAFNTNPVMNAYYENLHKPYAINGFSFDSTLTVKQDSVFNLIQYSRKFEIYANRVGLIQSHFQDFEIADFDISYPIKGKEVFMKVINYGIE